MRAPPLPPTAQSRRSDAEVVNRVAAVAEAPAQTERGWQHERALAESLLPAMSLARDTFGCRSVTEMLESPRFVDVLSVAGTLGDLDAMRLDDLAATGGLIESELIESFGDAVAHAVDENNPHHIDIYVRVYVERSATRKSIAAQEQKSDTTIGKYRAKVVSSLERHAGAHARLVATLTMSELSPIVVGDRVERRLDAVLSPLHEARGAHDVVTKLARHLVATRLGYSTSGPYSLTREAAAGVDELRRVVKAKADDVGLVDLDAIVKRVAPDLMPFHDELVALLKLSRVGSHLALRATEAARVKAAILELGRPATKEEISRISGIEVSRLTHRMPTGSSVTRATKTTWALTDWVEETYDSIPAMVGQRIRAHGGAVPASLLLEDIPKRFGVSRSSVESCLRAPWLEVVDGVVRLADESRFVYRPLDEVATRRSDGALGDDAEPVANAPTSQQRESGPAEAQVPERAWWTKFRRRRDRNRRAT